MKKLYLLFFLFLCTLVRAQTTETFETETAGSTTFTDNGQVFNITSNGPNLFDIYSSPSGFGWNGTAIDNAFIDNSSSVSSNVDFSVSTAGGNLFNLKNMYLYIAQSSSSLNVTGSVTITGSSGGATQFSVTSSSGFNTSLATANGFTYIDMSTYGSQNNASVLIDKFTITSTGNIKYIALDAMTWQAAPSCIPPTITSNPPNRAICSGSNTTFTVTASGATGYQWQVNTGAGFNNITNGGVYSGATSNTLTITGATAAMNGYLYRVTVINGSSSCSTNSNNGTLTVSNINLSSAAQSNVPCNGGSNGAAGVSPSGGISPYSYSWAPYGGSGAIATGLSAGNYTVTVTDNIGCQATKNFTITQPPSPLTATTSKTDVNCNSGTNGTASVSVSGGTPSYSYSWTPSGGTNATASGLAAGTYTCTITDANSCQITKTVTVNEPTILTATTSKTDVSCNGGTNGTATVSVSGGTPSYTYSWAPSGGTNATASGLAAGTYTCTITDANSCQITRTVTVNEPTALSLTPSSQTNVACNGGATGTASVNIATGGAGGYTYNWTPGNPTGDGTTSVSGLTAGTWTCTVTDTNSCTASYNFTITQPTALTATTSKTDVSCNGGTNGTATVSVSEGTPSYTYSWAPSGGTSATASGLAAGTYTCTITDANSCQITKTVTINQPTALSLTPSSQTNISCNGGANGAASVNIAAGGAGGYTYNWTPGNPTGDGTTSVTGLTAGTWTCTVTDNNGCVASVNFTITQPTAINLTVASQTNIVCSGAATGTATVNAATGGTGGYTYDWSPGNPTGDGTLSVSNLTAGTWTCTVTDDFGCSKSIDFTIVELTGSEIVWGSGSSNTTDDQNGKFANDFLIAGSWTPEDASGFPNSNQSWRRTATGTGQGAYWGSSSPIASPSQSDGAAIFDSDYLDNNGVAGNFGGGILPSPHKGRLVSPSFDLTGHNGQELYVDLYLYYRNFSITELSVGYSNDGGATWTDISILQPGIGANDVFDTAKVSYLLTDLTGVPNLTDCKLRFTFDGDYYFAMIDDVTIRTAEFEALSVTVDSQTNVACHGGTTGAITVSGTGGTAPYTYSWGNGANTASITNLAEGTYNVTITDANLCTANASINITEPTTGLSASTTATGASCYGNTDGSIDLTVTGGTAPYTYLWADSTTTEDRTGLTAGAYNVTVTDANGCTANASATVTEPSVLTASGIAINVSCNGGSNGAVNLTVTGGTAPYTYAWSNTATTEDITGLSAGTYDVTVTDAKSCTTTASVTVTEPSVLTASGVATNVSCNGGNNGAVDLTVTGGTAPYTYAWSNTATTEDITGLSAGTYDVTVTDAKGCTATESVTVTQPPVLLAYISSQTNILCNGGDTGNATVTAAGGTTPYTYLWSSGATTATATGLVGGNHSVTITDANGCNTTANVTITEPTAALSASGIVTNVSCNGGSNGAVNLTVTGGTAPYTFIWSNFATTEDQTGLSAGTYDVTVSDANSCTTTASVTVTEPSVLSASGVATNVSCNGGNNGAVDLTVTGGTAPYTYAWSNTATTEDITGLSAGTYDVTVTDAKGCTATESVTVTQPPVLLAYISSQTNILCKGGATGSATVTAAGGTTPYTYLWSNGAVTATATGLVGGNHSVTITDTNGCTTTVNVTLNEPTFALSAAISSQTNILCSGAATGNATVTAAGGTTPYTYLWSSGAVTATATGLVGGNHSVTITDANGCNTTANVTITEPISLNLTILTSNVTCNGGSNGSATATVSGGVAPYSYSWSDSGVVGANPTNLVAGTYTLTVSDNNGCTVNQTITIDEPDALSLSFSSDNVSCPGSSDGTATVAVSGGTAPYDYLWSNGATTASLIGLTDGTYTVTVTDDNGCTLIDSVTVITTPDVTAPVADVTTLPTITVECNVPAGMITAPTATDNCAGTVTATTTDPLTYTVQGTYTITWTYNDGNGNASTQTQTVVVDDITAPVADVTTLPTVTVECSVPTGMITAPTATDNCMGAVTATTTDPLTYTTQGTYTITWTYNDGNGNASTQTQTVVVDDITAPVADVTTLPTVTVECSVPAGMITAPTATDNCVGTVTATTTDPLTYTTQGTYTITWTYNDGNGNITTQIQTVGVNDITAPVSDVTNLPEIINYCGVMSDEIPVPTATDNCSGVLNATTTDPLDYTEIGTYIITWTYDDGNGNTTTQTQTITVDESPLNSVTFDDGTFVYNGTVQSIGVNNLPAGTTVTYTTSPETGSDNGAVNAGVYTVTAVVSPQPEAFNCNTITLTATITIDQAPQTITFNPIPVQNLETDVDFQLDATASSGLEVYYTYTYTSPDPAADVSSTGWVTLLTSGEITITAHQDGNENFLPAEVVNQPLIIESSDASIFTMVVGDVTYDTPQSNIYHLIDCGDNSDSVEVTMVIETGATVQPGQTFTIQTPQPGIYTETVTVTSQDGTSTETYTITVERRFDFSDIVVQKFDNVLLVNNNPQNNGGYEFTAYEWYKNGQLVGTEQYYSAGNNLGDMLDSDAEYMVKVTTAQGEVLQTCLGQIFLQHVNSARLYPNPVAFGQKLTIEADLPVAELEDMTIAIYTLNGALVKEVKSSSRITEIDAPMEEAVYIVMLKSANYSKTFKVIVR